MPTAAPTAATETPAETPASGLDAEIRIREMALSVAVASALQVAVRLGVADALDADEADAGELARAVGADADTLARLLRALAAHGVFEETGVGAGRFRHTGLSRLLRSDAAGGMADMVLWAGAAWTWDAWPRLEQAVRTGDAVVPDLHGKDFFRYLKEDAPADAQVFNRAMTQASALTSQAVAETLDLTGVTRIADIGGGHGHLLRTVLERHPHVDGELFDLPSVVAGADRELTTGALSGRAGVTPGDCLEAVPVKADLYLIKQILKWDDERSVRVLRNIAEHAAPGARIVVIQNLVDRSPEPRVTTAMDLFLLLNVGGREHFQRDFEGIFRAAGLEFTGVTQARSALYLIEARVPATRA
ncbi:16S rRNA G1207 methylase RsmC [Streptomyces misionensis]|uniref:16S rRNA G1207 methylase RsmC n=1 Tax=Streptomyces misionensis TaxID=67331 RepID=A0A1H4IAR2_9ACTN|nr:methyltransferase [Streptomyces misionensis]SEB30816.1 16S rRNA G1207 methylase RsmC [Streptomyces misionensis]